MEQAHTGSSRHKWRTATMGEYTMLQRASLEYKGKGMFRTWRNDSDFELATRIRGGGDAVLVLRRFDKRLPPSASAGGSAAESIGSGTNALSEEVVIGVEGLPDRSKKRAHRFNLRKSQPTSPNSAIAPTTNVSQLCDRNPPPPTHALTPSTAPHPTPPTPSNTYSYRGQQLGGRRRLALRRGGK